MYIYREIFCVYNVEKKMYRKRFVSFILKANGLDIYMKVTFWDILETNKEKCIEIQTSCRWKESFKSF